MYTCHNEPVPNRNQTNTVGEDRGDGGHLMKKGGVRWAGVWGKKSEFWAGVPEKKKGGGGREEKIGRG